MNKSLIFERAWRDYKIKLKHGLSSNFVDNLNHQFRIIKLIGKSNYHRVPGEFKI